MASHQSIAPFPDHIDRNHFGSWLSGFTDGEGSFNLVWMTRKNRLPIAHARFNIRLRLDDRPVLDTIASYFKVGVVRCFNYPSTRLNANPSADYIVNKIRDLNAVVVPHFERYPLLAKKSRDFHIWKQGVHLLKEVSQKPKRSRGYRLGQACCWTEDNRQEFESLRIALKAARSYDENLRGKTQFQVSRRPVSDEQRDFPLLFESQSRPVGPHPARREDCA